MYENTIRAPDVKKILLCLWAVTMSGSTPDPMKRLTPEVPWLSYSSLDPRFAGSNPAGIDGFFRVKNPEYNFLR